MSATTEAQLTSERIRETVRRIVASKSFATSERLVRFLEFSCEQVLAGKGPELKEQVLAIEVFGRDPSYDPKTNSLVRVTALKLRSKLIEYYADEGAGEPIRIELPKGSYAPVFRISSPVEAQNKPHTPKRRLAYFAAVAVGILAIVLAGLWWRSHALNSGKSVAVLPFVNLTADSKNEFFADGLTEEVIDALTKVQGLRVVARTSAFRFKGKQIDIREVGRELGVGVVLEGSIRSMGTRLRITAQLNRVSDGYHLWSESYEREFNDAFGIQEDVARAIVSKIQGVRSSNPVPTKWAQSYSGDPIVYSLHLQGRYYAGTYTTKGYKTAMDYFEQAIAKDPRYAPSYVGLADCHFLLGAAQMGVQRPEETVAIVRSLLAKALEIDPDLPEAHIVLGRLNAEYEWNFPAAEREFRRAIELAPGAVRAHLRYGIFLNFLGRHKEGIAELKTAKELDPLAPEPRTFLAQAYYFSRRYREAIEECDTNLRQNPRAWGAYLNKGLAEGGRGNHDAAVKAFQNSLMMAGDSTQVGLIAAAGHAYGRAGKQAEAQESLQRVLDEFKKRPYTSPMFVARVYLGLGDIDKVFEFLEKGYEYRDPQMLWLKSDPRFDAVRGDARYTSLVQRMNL